MVFSVLCQRSAPLQLLRAQRGSFPDSTWVPPPTLSPQSTGQTPWSMPLRSRGCSDRSAPALPPDCPPAAHAAKAPRCTPADHSLVPALSCLSPHSSPSSPPPLCCLGFFSLCLLCLFHGSQRLGHRHLSQSDLLNWKQEGSLGALARPLLCKTHCENLPKFGNNHVM